MAQVINTNVQSLNAQRNLNNSAVSLATSLQRLSSGLRINSAKDDAAGLAISERFSTQIRGLNVAVRNANDGISLSQTAEGALGEISNNLQRIRELAVQARNATNSASDRAALNAEVQQRLAEIDRTASQTSFNGQKILDGSFGQATFQVGSNAGETIGLSLDSSTRLDAIGKIASATSAQLGAASAGGEFDITSISALDYDQAASVATVGSITLSPATRNFGTAADAAQVDGTNVTNPSTLTFGTAAVDGTSTPFNVSTLNFGTAAAAQIDGFNDQGPITDFDYSGGGLNVAQLDIDGIGITLSADYTDADGVAAEIESQLQAVDADYNVVNNAGTLTISRTGSLAAIAVTNADANATAAGFANTAGTAGTAAVATTNASFDVDGFTVTLNQNYASDAALAADIDTQLGAFYTAADDGGGNITITHTSNSAAVVISAPDANATAAGITASAGSAGSAAVAAQFDVDGDTVTLSLSAYANDAALAADIQSQLVGYTVDDTTNPGSLTFTKTGSTDAVVISGANAEAIAGGIVNSAGTAGTAAQSATNATFTVGGEVVTLTADFADYDAVAAAIDADLSAAFSVVNDNGAITISRTGAPGSGSLSVDVTGANAYAGTVGLGNQVGTAGVDAVTTGSVEFSVDGNTVTLNQDYTADLAGLITEVQTQLDAAASGAYTVADNGGGGITITNNTAGSAAPVVVAGAGDAGANATAAGFATGTSTAGTIGGTVTLASGDFTIQGATGDAVEFEGTYASLQALADDINSNLSGVFASVTDNGELSLQSAQGFTLGGTEATGDLGFASTTVAASSGTLADTNVLTTDDADAAIIRVDSALQSISSLRSDFGAIQNRFESTIANLQGTAENLAASRSRILDADFASETANLTRAQILQQAGVAILAQANQLPQNVLSLLR